MSLPTRAELKTLDWSFQGQPFCMVDAQGNVNLATMDWAFQGQPFVIMQIESIPDDFIPQIMIF